MAKQRQTRCPRLEGHMIEPLQLRGHETVSLRDIHSIFNLLKNAYRNLFFSDSANKKGHWNEARSTALAAMCLRRRESPDSHWLVAIRKWIEAQQIAKGPEDGSWGEEIWDTAMCVLALLDFEVSPKEKVIAKALSWMAKLFAVSGRMNWHDEPWETSWALMAFLHCANEGPKVDCEAAMRWLANLQDENGCIVAPHYTAYFILLEYYWRTLGHTETSRPSFGQTSVKCRSYLLELLRTSSDETLWTGEAWSNGQILWALCRSNMFREAESPLVEKVIKWFCTKQMPSGSWADTEDNASAILGLFALRDLLARQTGPQAGDDLLIRDFHGCLKEAVPMPRLEIKKKLYEYEPETGYSAFNIRRKTLNVFLAVLAFILVTLLGWIANLLSLLPYLGVGRK